MNKDEFVAKATRVHGDKFDYSKFEYIQAHHKSIIICPVHGEFLQEPAAHLYGYGCKWCADEANGKRQTKTLASFIRDAGKVHGDKYDYQKVVYVSSDKKICIICPTHGEFMQTPNGHLSGRGCPSCGRVTVGLKKRKQQDVFIKEAMDLHGGYYSYSKVVYVNALSKVIITCPKHGDFLQQPNDHINGHGCSKCGDDQTSIRSTYTLEKYMELANKVHNNKYDYSKSIYINSVTKMIIICPIHGEFLQTPSMHLHSLGCSKCSCSVGELSIDAYLTAHNIPHTHQYRDHQCKAKRILPFDFAVFHDENKTDIRAFIEFDGIQHFNVVAFFGGEERHKQRKEYDKLKDEYCLTRGIKLIRIPYIKMDNIDSILSEELNIEG